MPFKPLPRVLCVDDDADCREMLSTILKHWRIDTKAVGTATQALSLIQEESFDLYLLDAWLPDMNGFELCRRMREVDRVTPIFFFSGAAYESDKKIALEAGANAYLAKPYVEELLGAIKQVISPAQTASSRVELNDLDKNRPLFAFQIA